jgi:hypothetical protein
MGGGGVSAGQLNNAVAGQANLAGNANTQMTQQQQQQNSDQGAATGFFKNQMTNGLPFYNSLTDYGAGANAQAFAPQRAQMLRQTSQYGNMPSGYRDSVTANLGAQQATAFDSTLTQNMMAQQMAKNQGAAGMQGQQQIAGQQALGYGGMQGTANQSVISGPQKPTTAGVLGGLAQSALQAGGQVGAAAVKG